MIDTVESKHLKFIDAEPAAKTRRVWVVNKHEDAQLGKISWYGPWRRYGFYPLPNMVFEQDCLRDIANYIEQMTKEHKSK